MGDIVKKLKGHYNKLCQNKVHFLQAGLCHP